MIHRRKGLPRFGEGRLWEFGAHYLVYLAATLTVWGVVQVKHVVASVQDHERRIRSLEAEIQGLREH